jgi:peptide subunit release factor 1 (eRF1)
LNDDHTLYGVLNADQKEAVLGLFSRAHLEQSLLVEGTGYPRKQKQGGWSQRRFQARADERVAAFAKVVADETRKVLEDENISMLVVAGDEIITSSLGEAFHQTVKERIIGTLRLDNNLSDNEIGQAAEPLVAAAEREQEAETVATFKDGLGDGGLGTAGAKGTLSALQAGQVRRLILNDDLRQEGWADFDLQVYGLGAVPKAHPAGGDRENMTGVRLEELLVWLALQTGADIQMIRTESPISAEDLADIPDAGE